VEARSLTDRGITKSHPARRSLLARFGVAIGCVALGWVAREALIPSSGQTAFPFVFFFPAVALSAWYGGLGSGLLSVLLSAAVADWFFIEPIHSWSLTGFGAVEALVAFIISASVTVAAMEAMHRANARIRKEVEARERAEAREKEMLATTISSIGDAVIVTDEKGGVTFLNSEAERLTGWKSSEARGQPLTKVFRIVNERTRQEAENPVEKALRSGTVTGLANHTALLARDGRETPIDDSAAPIRIAGGPILGVVLVFHDVTTQRMAQQSAERLAAIVEHSGDAMITKNLDGVVQTWNVSAEKLFGYRAEEIIGRPVTTLFPPDRLNEEDHILDLLRGGQPVERFETLRLGKDGRPIHVAVSVSPLRNEEGEVVGASKVIHDITDLVVARESLSREKELLATTLASIGDAVIVTDANGRITFLNAEAQRLTKWSEVDAFGEPLPNVFRIINEQTRNPVENPVEKVLRHGGVVGLANHTLLIAKDGNEVPIDDSAAPIRLPEGPLFGVVLVFRDFTEHKKAEQALRESAEKLKLHAADLEATVEERTTKLQEKVNELQHISYAIAHDMRAPLRAMNTFATILLQNAAEGGDAAQAEDYCRRIITASLRLDKQIQDALHYTKIAEQEVPVEPVALSQLIQDLIHTYPNLQAEKAHISIEHDLPTVLGNDGLLAQCFSNLLGNAVKFVSPGAKPEVRIAAERRDGVARIWVKDNGIGIPKDAQARLFKMFQKLDSDYEGTGIGLAIVRKVAERLGGNVGVESEPGLGSRFWVELPVAKDESEAKPRR
jgi:PAS domain S-box-containing protein